MASTSGPIRVLHFGLGPIGLGIVRQVASRKGFKIVGAVDIDPAKAGRDLGEVAGVGRPLRVKVSADARKTIRSTKPDVVVLCTLSSLKKVLPQMEEILNLRVPIVSTTEELAYPTAGTMKYARAIHALSPRRAGPFVARNAATLPEGLVDAELFGSVRNYPNAGSPERAVARLLGCVVCGALRGGGHRASLRPSRA